jgi:hypothetical protein
VLITGRPLGYRAPRLDARENRRAGAPASTSGSAEPVSQRPSMARAVGQRAQRQPGSAPSAESRRTRAIRRLVSRISRACISAARAPPSSMQQAATVAVLRCNRLPLLLSSDATGFRCCCPSLSVRVSAGSRVSMQPGCRCCCPPVGTMSSREPAARSGHPYFIRDTSRRIARVRRDSADVADPGCRWARCPTARAIEAGPARRAQQGVPQAPSAVGSAQGSVPEMSWVQSRPFPDAHYGPSFLTFGDLK